MLVSNKAFRGSINKKHLHYNSSRFYDLADEVLYHSNELTKNEALFVYESIKDKRTPEIAALAKEFILIVIDFKCDEVYAVSDITGRDLLYVSSESLAISEDFWEVIRAENKSSKDVNIQRCKEFILTLADVEHKTIVNGIEILPSATVMIFDKNNKIDKQKYWSYKKISNKYAIEEKYAQLEEVLSEFFLNISKEFKGEAFGVGVSGGLDSRLIPYYCDRYGIRIKPYIIGEKTPNFVLDSNDHKRSHEICNKYGLDLVVHEFSNNHLAEKVRDDALRAPSTASQIFKMPNPDYISFDKILTGASGYIVGSSPFYGNAESILLKETIIRRQTIFKYYPKFKKSKKVISYLLGLKLNVEEIIPGEFVGVMTDVEAEVWNAKLDKYISSYQGHDATEVLMNYAVDVLGQRNKSGAFESLLCRTKSFTMYGPAMLKTVQYWNDDDLFNRKLFENFIRDCHPELASIKGQDHRSSLDTIHESSWARMINIIEFGLRGRGVVNYEVRAKNRRFIRDVRSILNNYSYIKDFIDIDLIISSVSKGTMPAQVLLNCIKVNEIMHLINSRD